MDRRAYRSVPEVGPWCAALGVALTACGDGGPALSRTVLGLGEVPGRLASVSVAVFDEDGLVTSATASPARYEIELGVPAEVPLRFEVIGRTATAAPAAFGGFMPAFVGRVERTIPLASVPVRVGVEARPAGALELLISASNVPDGVIAIDSASGVPGVRFRLSGRPSSRSFAVLGRGRQRVTFQPDDPTRVVEVRGGDDLWVAAELINAADVEIGAPRPRRRLSLVALAADGTVVEPVSGVVDAVTLSVSSTLDGTEEVDLTRVVRLSQTAVGDATIEGLPEAIEGVPTVLAGLTVLGTGRLVVRSDTGEEGGESGASAVTVFNVGAAPGPPAGLALSLADPGALRAGTELEVWTVDAAGRLTEPPPGELSFADSDPWVVLPDGQVVGVAGVEDARVRRRIALTSRPRDGGVVLRARLHTEMGTLSAILGLR